MSTPMIPGLDVPPLALGTMYFGTRVAREQAFAVLDQARAVGARFLDTANNYAQWEPGGTGDESESCLGRWLAARGPAARTEMVIATKLGAREARSGGGLDDALGLSAAAVGPQLEESLRRLGTDYVDLVYAHVDDPLVDAAETVGALQCLVDRGLARRFGASNLRAERLEEVVAAAGHGPRHVVLQNRFTYLTPLPGGDLGPHVPLGDDALAACVSAGVTAAGYSVLMEGGAYSRLDRPLHPAYGTRESNRAALEVLDEVAAAAGLDAGQAVLSWMVRRAQPVLPIVGVSAPDHVDAAWTAIGTDLPAGAITRLDQARRR